LSHLESIQGYLQIEIGYKKEIQETKDDKVGAGIKH
jgi:hypothetical protein